MTRPTLIVLMHDNLGAGEVIPKIFMRSLLYTTGNRGHVVQSMYLKIQQGEATQNFSIWGHGPQTELRFGAGMKVGPDGVDHNHHFNPPKNAHYQYSPGEYVIETFAELADSGKRIRLSRTVVIVTPEQAEMLKSPDKSLYFEWGPDAQSYSAHVHTRQLNNRGLPELLQLLAPKEIEEYGDSST